MTFLFAWGAFLAVLAHSARHKKRKMGVAKRSLPILVAILPLRDNISANIVLTLVVIFLVVFSRFCRCFVDLFKNFNFC